MILMNKSGPLARFCFWESSGVMREHDKYRLRQIFYIQQAVLRKQGAFDSISCPAKRGSV